MSELIESQADAGREGHGGSFLRGLRVAATFVGIAVLVMIGGCMVIGTFIDPCDDRVLSRATGPSAAFDAVVFERSCFIRSANLLAVVPAGSKPDAEYGRSLGRDVEFTVRWKDARTIAVCSYDPSVDPPAEVNGIAVVFECP